MAFGVAAHAGQTEYDPAKVSDSLRAVFKFGSVSTTKALNANTVTLLSGTIGGTYVQLVGVNSPKYSRGSAWRNWPMSTASPRLAN